MALLKDVWGTGDKQQVIGTPFQDGTVQGDMGAKAIIRYAAWNIWRNIYAERQAHPDGSATHCWLGNALFLWNARLHRKHICVTSLSRWRVSGM